MRKLDEMIKENDWRVTKMRKLDEMNYLEKEGAKTLLKKEGWSSCSIGRYLLPSVAGWTKGKIAIAKATAYHRKYIKPWGRNTN